MEKNLTNGSVFKTLISFSLPFLLSHFLQTLYGMADLLIIGIYNGVDATTAVSVGSQVMHMITVMIVGLAMGTTVNIAQAVGSQDKRKTALFTGNTVTFFAAVSVALTFVLLLLTRPITSLVSTPAQAVEGTVDYLKICFIGIPFITGYNIISAVFRGMGDSKSPMYFIAVACMVNIALDFLFIGKFGMGAAGAALGTTLSQTVSVIISLIFIIKKKMIALIRADFKPKKEIVSSIFKIGAPIALQDGLIQIAFIVITVIANRRGLTDAAAVGIVEKIISFVFLVPSSMLSSVSALGAQNIGAKKENRAVKTLKYAVLITVCFGIAVTALTQFIAMDAVSLFTKDKAVIIAGSLYLKGYIFDCIFAGIHFSFSGYFCAKGRSELSFIHNIISITFVRIPAVYFASEIFKTTLFPMGLATALGSLVSVIICIIAFKAIQKKSVTRI